MMGELTVGVTVEGDLLGTVVVIVDEHIPQACLHVVEEGRILRTRLSLWTQNISIQQLDSR